MICAEFECLFVHVPKTGGQSIAQFFLDRLGLTWEERDRLLMRPNDDPAAGPPRLTHLTAEEYPRLGYLDEERFRRWFKFAFVRNPWDRLVSDYLFFHAGRHGFKRFVLERFPTPADDCYRNHAARYRHVIPQHRFLYDEEGRPLVDFIGRFERLNDDFAEVAKHLGIEGAVTLPHRNGAANNFRRRLLQRGLARPEQRITPLRRPDYRNFYDEETRAFVAEYYARDIELFGYRFDTGFDEAAADTVKEVRG